MTLLGILLILLRLVRKHPAPQGALRHDGSDSHDTHDILPSESTQHQETH